ncbi:polymorphic toxin-type HINT domain-containing protein [Micromonospora yasonensis]|uniref:polymorphic toxin-type HINT domain-containing protein n=1 Tax=Micromonospora yasonensis TaxID=1128667 RepID=UPI00222FCE14|nr:polymorphic toxin-type HINT domain-containing protein [Micromonospora yasonensis]MCW3844991.1 polymorphic toxin-type HINT domain-containing protein [Micromonospora yasonensis]
MDGHLFGMSWSDIGHAALDVAGMVPVIGEVADVANGIWYAAEGNYVDAALSLASAIPLAGNAVAAAKLAKTGKKIADGIDTARDIEKAAENAKSLEKGVEGATDVNKAAPTNTPTTKVDEPTAPKQTTPTKCNSFVPGTKVLLADGSTKAIEDLKLGDQVLGTDVESGQNQGRAVTNVRSHEGSKTLVTITVDVDGKAGSKTGSITSTAAHLIWLPDAGQWVTGGDLKPGMWLQTAAGTWVQITAITKTVRHERVHNLTVEGIHTYYVFAGNTPVLVHNCGSGTRDGAGMSDDELLQAAQDLRDEFAQSVTGKKYSPASVTAGYNVETRQFAAGHSTGNGNCAEVCVINQLGGDPSKIRFTTAVRPRTGKQLPICFSCEATSPRSHFPPNTQFRSDFIASFYE